MSEAQDVDLFAGVIEEMFQLADNDKKGYVNKDEFTQVCMMSINCYQYTCHCCYLLCMVDVCRCFNLNRC